MNLRSGLVIELIKLVAIVYSFQFTVVISVFEEIDYKRNGFTRVPHPDVDSSLLWRIFFIVA